MMAFEQTRHLAFFFGRVQSSVCVQSAAHVFGITRRPEPRVAREWLGRGEAACSVASQNSPYGGLWVKGARRAVFLSSFSSFSPRAASGRAIKNLSAVKRIYVHAAAFPRNSALRSLLFALLAVRFMVRFLLIDPARCLLRLHSAVCSQQHGQQHAALSLSLSQPRARARALFYPGSQGCSSASPSDALL